MPEHSPTTAAQETPQERRQRPFTRRELVVEAGFALPFLAAAIAIAVLAAPARAFSLPVAVLFVLLFAGVSRVGFAIHDAWQTPVGLIAFPMLLLLPTPLVPLLVALGLLLSQALSVVRGERTPDRLLLPPLSDSFFSLAPVLVLIALDAQLPAWHSLPAYAAAFAAQAVLDVAAVALRMRLVTGRRGWALARACARGYEIELLLSPVGILAAIASADHPAGVLFVVPPVILLSVFARERDARIAQTVELGRSYRGTALLLAELLEDDDEYTGHHTQDVVELSGLVAEQMVLSEELTRETELGALLHDIGKIHIPDAIINKPGKLDAEEWELMKTHTVEGQKLLDRVGGFLSDVGIVVRASHERYDGGGYPDGLAGQDIPLAARIIAVCDSYNAMTTTRSYRQAMPRPDAIAELQRCSGTQFDPVAVEALLAVITAPSAAPAARETAVRFTPAVA
jgi:HD-GYP domain-containing protein (c-di-GMP phosphodiesterase class II)